MESILKRGQRMFLNRSVRMTAAEFCYKMRDGNQLFNFFFTRTRKFRKSSSSWIIYSFERAKSGTLKEFYASKSLTFFLFAVRDRTRALPPQSSRTRNKIPLEISTNLTQQHFCPKFPRGSLPLMCSPLSAVDSDRTAQTKPKGRRSPLVLLHLSLSFLSPFARLLLFKRRPLRGG